MPAPPMLAPGDDVRARRTTTGVTPSAFPGIRRRRSIGWRSIFVSAVLLAGAAGLVVTVIKIVVPRVNERAGLDTAVIGMTPDGVQVGDGDVTFHLPAAPRVVPAHLAGESAVATGFRLTLSAGTVEVDVKKTHAARPIADHQAFCANQIAAITAARGAPSTDISHTALGVVARTATWKVGDEYWFAACRGAGRNDALATAHSSLEQFPAYELARATLVVVD